MAHARRLTATTVRPRSHNHGGWTAALIAAAGAAALAGCVDRPRWVGQRQVTTQQVADTLGEAAPTGGDLKPSEIPAIPVRENLRPCCAFGTQLHASLGSVPIPFFSLGNIIGPDEIGPHKYDSGAFSMKGSSEKNAFSKENNALIYTCRGGFIDTAHVRDYADWTAFWAATIARLSETGGTVELPPEGGKRRVIIKPLDPKLLDRYGLRRLAVRLGQWTAFQLSVWHEIATAYGFASIELYPEYVSAFSPEDLYSNLLGIKIAGGLLLTTGSAATDSLYDESMDNWLRVSIGYLEPVSAEAGKEAAMLVDGIWWDSKARLPDPRLVLRRNLDEGDAIAPWLISESGSSPQLQAWVDRFCGGKERPIVLHRSSRIDRRPIADLVTYEIDVDVPDRFPFPRKDSNRITQADFPSIVAATRAEVLRRLGPNADRPGDGPARDGAAGASAAGASASEVNGPGGAASGNDAPGAGGARQSASAGSGR